MIELEKSGTPAVLIASGRFQRATIAAAEALGMPNISHVVIPGIMRNLTTEETIQQTKQAFSALIQELTTNRSGQGNATTKVTATAPEVERFEGEDPLDAVNMMNRKYLDRD